MKNTLTFVGTRIFFLVFIVALVSSCVGKRNPTGEKTDASKYPHRIISLAPSITETLFALGLGEKVVGVTTHCSYPPEAVEIPKVGGYMDINFEMLIKLNPDLVIATRHHEEEIAKLGELEMERMIIEDETIEQIIQSILDIGEATGRIEEAERIVAGMKAKMSRARTGKPGVAPPRAVLVVGRNPGTMQSIYVAGKNTYLNQLLKLGGLKNVFDDVKASYPQPSLEEMIFRNPQVIIEARHGVDLSDMEIEKIKKEWGALGDIDAVRDERIYVWTENYISIPGPRIVNILDKIAQISKYSDNSPR